MSSVFIWSALSSDAQGSYGLNVSGCDNWAGAQIILYPWTGGAANELWTLDSDNHLITNMNSNLVIGIDSSNSIVLCELAAGDASQQWSVVNGMIQNQANQLVISASTDTTLSLIAVPSAPSASEIWQYTADLPIPVKYIPQWRLIQGSSQTAGTVYLDVLNGQATDGAIAVFAPASQGPTQSPTQNWMITPDGRVMNGEGIALVLGFWNYVNYGRGLTVESQGSSLRTDQQWSVGSGYIASVNDGQYLDVTSETVGGQWISNAAVTVPSPSSLDITVLPVDPLTASATAGPQPFPDFQSISEQSQAYASIVDALNGLGDFSGDLRATYTNLDFTANFGTWLEEIQSRIERPPTISPSNWEAVQNQLVAELQAVAATQTLYSNYQNLHTQLFASQSTIVNEAIATLNLEDQGGNPQVNGHVWMILDNIFYTLVESLPAPGVLFNPFAILGNLLQCIVNTTTASSSPTGQVPEAPFQQQVAEVWGQLNSNFTSIGISAANLFTAILSDWGKLSATFALINATGLDSLNWQPGMYADASSAAQAGFTLAAYQMLMPGKYMIYGITTDNSDPMTNIPQVCKLLVEGPPGSGYWTTYWVADRTDMNNYPDPDEVMKVIFGGDGTPPPSFFSSAGNWGLLNTGYIDSGWGCSWACVTLSNQSFQQLNVTMDPGDAGPKGGPLPPYGACTISDSWGGSGLNMSFSVYDPTISEPVIAFEVTLAADKGATPQVLNLTTNSGYVTSPPLIGPGTYNQWGDWSIMNSVQMSIRYYPANYAPPPL